MSGNDVEEHLPIESGFPARLRMGRKNRRLSQLELSLSAGVSQRHLSFLESGRAKPSREMILKLSENLEIPLRERNDWLVAAGFAPVFRARAFDDPQMRQVMGAVRWMLDNHLPFPAVAIDRVWNIRRSNSAFDRLVEIGQSNQTTSLWERVGGGEKNLLRLLFHPQGIRENVQNWDTVAPLIWNRAQREALSLGSHEMKCVLGELAPHQDELELWTETETAQAPVLPLELKHMDLRLSLFTVIATFGTAQDITADELRIESFFPADEATDRLFRSGSL